jgi:hypothetical protein
VKRHQTWLAFLLLHGPPACTLVLKGRENATPSLPADGRSREAHAAAARAAAAGSGASCSPRTS